MTRGKPPPAMGVDNELLALIATLSDTEQRLKELTGGEVDTVTGRDGQTFLLRHAQEQLRHSDITERKQAEAALSGSEAEFRLLAEAMPHMVWIMRHDGWNLYFSQQWMDYTGLTLEESLGHGWSKPFHPDDQERARDAWEQATATIATYSLECRLRRADGAYRWWLIRGVPQRDADGNVLKWFGTCTDIHDLKLAEIEVSRTNRELRDSEEKFHQLAANVTDVFYTTSADMQQMLYVSPAYAEIWGRPVASLYADPGQWHAAILPEEREAVYAKFSRLATGTASVAAKFRIARPDGTVRWILSRGFQVRDATGKVIRITGIASDITERKQAEVELEHTHRQLLDVSRQAGMAEVATAVLHNVGNVLTSVTVASSCLADSLRRSKAANLSKVVAMLGEHEDDLGTFLSADPRGKQLPAYLAQLAAHLAREQADALEELAQLQKHVDHIQGIVTMQQSFAKTSGVTEIIDVRELVEDALRMNSSGLGWHSVEVIRDFEDTPLVTVEKHKVLQILVNLMRNAKEACQAAERQGRRLTIRTTRAEHFVCIAVRDNGVGVPPGNLTRIFSHGFTTKKDGHGFGLHSSALAAQEMGGSLSVHSDGVGLGATFTLALPLLTKTGNEPTPSP